MLTALAKLISFVSTYRQNGGKLTEEAWEDGYELANQVLLTDESLEAVSIAANFVALYCLRGIWKDVPECSMSSTCGALYIVKIREDRGEVAKGTAARMEEGRVPCSKWECLLHPDHGQISRPDPAKCIEVIPLDESVPVHLR